MKYTRFTIEEREKIQEMLWQKTSIRTIAAALGRSASSVSIEIKRNFRYLVKIFQKDINIPINSREKNRHF